MPSRFETAKGDPRFAAAVVDVDEQTGPGPGHRPDAPDGRGHPRALSPAILSACRYAPGASPGPSASGPSSTPCPIGLYVVDRDLVVVAWNRGREQGPIGRPRSRAVGRPLQAVLGAAGFRATEPALREVFRTGRPHEETSRRRPGSSTCGGCRCARAGRSPTSSPGSRTSPSAPGPRDAPHRLRPARLPRASSSPVSPTRSRTPWPASRAARRRSPRSPRRADRGSAREARQFRDLIRAEVARCEKIVRFLLDASRPTPGTARTSARPWPLALRLLERHPALARLRVEASLPKALPPAADRHRLAQAGGHGPGHERLVGDAGGRHPRRPRQPPGTNRSSSTSPTRAPVPGERGAPRLFEPFATVDAQRGAGLGLAIARSLLRSRGGDLVLPAPEGRQLVPRRPSRRYRYSHERHRLPRARRRGRADVRPHRDPLPPEGGPRGEDLHQRARAP